MEDYRRGIEQAREILKGNTRGLLRSLHDEMQRLAGELRFEEAEEVKRRYQLVAGFVAKSEVVSHTISNVDVFTITSDDKTALHKLHPRHGGQHQPVVHLRIPQEAR